MIVEKPRVDAQTIRRSQLALVLGTAAFIACAYVFSDGFRAEIRKASDILGSGNLDALKEYILSFGMWAPVASLVLMVLQALAAPVPGFVVVFANGLAFGLFWGWLLSLAGQVLAAAICFWLARSLGRGPVSAMVGRVGLESTDRWFGRWGAHAVLVTRLIPGMAFDAISYAAGLTQMGFVRFLGATAIGTAPSALLYAYLGHEAPQFGWALLVASIAVSTAVAVSVIVRRRQMASPALQSDSSAAVVIAPRDMGAAGVARPARIRNALRAIGRLMEESPGVRLSVFALGGLLVFLVVGQLVEPGFTDYWGYLLAQISVILFVILWLSHRFAAGGGFSGITYAVVLGALTVDTLGNTAQLYAQFESYDKFVHAVGTAAAAAASYDILAALNRNGRIAWSARRRVVIAVGAAMLLATGWEIYEFTADQLFETYRYAGPTDAFYDLIFDAAGAIAMCLLLWRRETRRAATTPARPAIGAHMTPRGAAAKRWFPDRP